MADFIRLDSRALTGMIKINDVRGVGAWGNRRFGNLIKRIFFSSLFLTHTHTHDFEEKQKKTRIAS